MAKLQFSAPLLLKVLFPDQQFLHLRGAVFDPATDVVTLDLDGPGVPAVENIRCEVRVERRQTLFVATQETTPR